MTCSPRTWHEPSFVGDIGVARRDITPPAGIYARNWGAALHDTADGVHRELTSTVLAARDSSQGGPPFVLAAIDAGWFRGPEGAQRLRDLACAGLEIGNDRFVLALSHTHSGPSISPAERGKPGGDLIEPYLDSVGDAIVSAGREAIRKARPSVLTVAAGRCAMACNRDLPDPDGPSDARDFICGFNPDGVADDTCLVGRITACDNGTPVATLVNYACHPTTLGPTNRLISPDFVGSMRELVEAHTEGVPCLFLQGASGELAPRRQYLADCSVADMYGRSLGYEVLAVLAQMLPPQHGLEYSGVIQSGAPLADWRECIVRPPSTSACRELDVEIALKPSLRSLDQINAELAACTDRARRERLHRESLVVRTVGSGPVTRRHVWIWRLGDVIFVGHADEAYSHLQRELRSAFPDRAVFVMNVVNGWGGYMCPERLYGRRQYQVIQSPYASGCLEALIRDCISAIRALLADEGAGARGGCGQLRSQDRCVGTPGGTS